MCWWCMPGHQVAFRPQKRRKNHSLFRICHTTMNHWYKKTAAQTHTYMHTLEVDETNMRLLTMKRERKKETD